MKMPEFTAETSLHKTTATWRSDRTDGLVNGKRRITPQFDLRAVGVGGGAVGIGGRALSFACGGNVCACSGDADCNGMVTVACGGSYAKCWTRSNGNVFCICSRSC